jgi:hypothetical protein
MRKSGRARCAPRDGLQGWAGRFAGQDERVETSVGHRIRKNGDLCGTPNVRLIGSSGQALGVMTLAQALRLAVKEGRVNRRRWKGSA